MVSGAIVILVACYILSSYPYWATEEIKQPEYDTTPTSNFADMMRKWQENMQKWQDAMQAYGQRTQAVNEWQRNTLYLLVPTLAIIGLTFIFLGVTQSLRKGKRR